MCFLFKKNSVLLIDWQHKMTSTSNSWFIFPNPTPTPSVRLFCFHYAGGNALFFYPWVKLLDPSVELVLIQLPGHGTQFTEPLLTDMKSIICYLKEAILPYCDRPYFFFGHSLGALIAFELAHTLQKSNKLIPQCLFASGKRPPHIANDPLTYNLPDEQFIEEIKKYNGLPSEILEDSEIMSLWLPILRADFKILETYSLENIFPLACDLIALGGTRDPMVTPSDIQAWKIYTAGKFQDYLLPGDHFFIKPQQQEVMKIISHAIQQFTGKNENGFWGVHGSLRQQI